MNAASRLLGESFRKLSSMLNAKAVRYEDEVRDERRPAGVEGRAEEIRRQALSAERSTLGR